MKTFDQLLIELERRLFPVLTFLAGYGLVSIVEDAVRIIFGLIALW